MPRPTFPPWTALRLLPTLRQPSMTANITLINGNVVLHSHVHIVHKSLCTWYANGMADVHNWPHCPYTSYTPKWLHWDQKLPKQPPTSPEAPSLHLPTAPSTTQNEFHASPQQTHIYDGYFHFLTSNALLFALSYRVVRISPPNTLPPTTSCANSFRTSGIRRACTKLPPSSMRKSTEWGR